MYKYVVSYTTFFELVYSFELVTGGECERGIVKKTDILRFPTMPPC